jgi:hypothetical protein
MFIAQKKKKENIAEYLLYMWQIEDIIRANRFDMELIRATVVSRYEQPAEVKEQIARWYDAIRETMCKEDVREKGHIQENNRIVAALTGLHRRLLGAPGEQVYNAAYYKVLPVIVQLRSKSGGNEIPEIETCLIAVYGYLTLKMQQKEISPETMEGIRQVVAFLSILAEKYKADRQGELNLE